MTTWKNPWAAPTIPLYEGLTKAEQTALFLMRTEVIGLRAWLAAAGVPGITPRCDCGWAAQTVHHILFRCPRYSRRDLIEKCPSERVWEVLNKAESAQAAARWWVQRGILEQFRVAKEIDKEDTGSYQPLRNLEAW